MYSLFRIKDYICIVILGLIKKLYSYFRTSQFDLQEQDKAYIFRPFIRNGANGGKQIIKPVF